MSGFVDVQDVVKAMISLMESEITAQRFIISGANLPYRSVFTMIANAFGKKPPHKKVTTWMAAIVWRLEAIKSKFTGKSPLLTKKTAKTARAKVRFNNEKLLKAIPDFQYTPMEQSITRICNELKQKYRLP